MAYQHLTGGGTGGAFVVGDRVGYQKVERIRQNFRALAGIRHILPLGGSRNQALQHNAVIEAYDYLDVPMDSADMAGLRVRVRVELRVENAGLSVTPSLRNVTDGSDVATGVACSATNADYSGTNQKQTLEVTLPTTTGEKFYRLRFTPTNNTYRFWGLGFVHIYFNDDVVIAVPTGSLTLAGQTPTRVVA